jgi:5-methylcytosine-specific restriction endonuclease McrA
MSKRHKAWARTAKTHMRAQLGGVCAACGTVENLEFDCIAARGHRHHGMSSDQRACFYRAQFRLGNLQLLCTSCNARKGDMSQEDWLVLLNTERNCVKDTAVLRPVNNTNNQHRALLPREYSEVTP